MRNQLHIFAFSVTWDVQSLSKSSDRQMPVFLDNSDDSIDVGRCYNLWPWSSWTANSDKKYMELNGAVLNVNKPCVTSEKTAFPKD